LDRNLWGLVEENTEIISTYIKSHKFNCYIKVQNSIEDNKAITINNKTESVYCEYIDINSLGISYPTFNILTTRTIAPHISKLAKNEIYTLLKKLYLEKFYN